MSACAAATSPAATRPATSSLATAREARKPVEETASTRAPSSSKSGVPATEQRISTPIVLRVLRGAPEVVFGIGLTWMVVEIVGAVAARRIVLADDGVGGALRSAVRSAVRHPAAALASFWVPTLGLIVVLVPSALAAAAAAGAVRSVFREPGGPVAVLVAVLSLVFLWGVGLLLAAVVCAWRTAVWTVAAIARDGTFGGSTDRRPGDWRRDRSSGTL